MGWYQDHRRHDKPQKWYLKGQKLNKAKHLSMLQQVKEKQKQLEERREKTYNHTQRRITLAYHLMSEAQNHAYLENKQVNAYKGVKIDKKNRLVIPLYNQKGEIRSLQRIDERGFKSLKKNAQKAGSFFIVGQEEKEAEGQETEQKNIILYAEGYSTSASIYEAIKISRPYSYHLCR